MTHSSRIGRALSPSASVVVPAHNEERSISRLLDALTRAQPGELDVVVSCNGCTDATARIARGYGGDVRVIESPTPSKTGALRAGDGATSAFPRLYVDADVVLDVDSVRALVQTLSQPGIHAAAPERHLDTTGASWPVRAYYALWQHLPAVTTGLYGRGVIAVDADGHARLAAMPDVLGDDLYANNAFAPGERRVVASARAVIRTPRRASDLIRRRARAALGNAQQAGTSSPGAPASTGMRDIVRVAIAKPRLASCVPVFLAVTFAARVTARRQARRGSTQWLRDESSR